MANKLIFLSGKMSGLHDYGRSTFKRYEDIFRSLGYSVINPACLPTDIPDERCLPITLAMLSQCDGIFMIPGWEESNGAKLEKAYADRCKIPTITLDNKGVKHD